MGVFGGQTEIVKTLGHRCSRSGTSVQFITKQIEIERIRYKPTSTRNIVGGEPTGLNDTKVVRFSIKLGKVGYSITPFSGLFFVSLCI